MITHARLLELLHYDPETGIFTWAIDSFGKIKKGQVAGTKIGKNYRQIMIDGEKYTSHRLAWFYAYGRWPTANIDHKRHSDGDRLSNLREASVKQNSYNMKPKPGHSLWKGVTYDPHGRKCWKMAFKMPSGERIQRRFEDEREAAEKYMFLALEHHGEFARFE